MVDNEIDQYIGLKIKIKRSALGITQNELGGILGVTFQQVQKYEKGKSKINVSKLYQIANVLNVPISFFLDEIHRSNKFLTFSDSRVVEYDCKQEPDIRDKEVICLLKFFNRIKDKKTRESVVHLAKYLAASFKKSGKNL